MVVLSQMKKKILVFEKKENQLKEKPQPDCLRRI